MTQIKSSQRKGKASLAALTASSNMSDTAVLTSTGAFANTGVGHNFVREARPGLATGVTEYDLAREARPGLATGVTEYDLAREARPGLATGVTEYDLARESSNGYAVSDMNTVSV